MKVFLKTPVYFEITVPDGSNRQQIIKLAGDQLRPALRSILDSIKVDPEDLQGFPGEFGKTLRVRLVDEIEVHHAQLVKQKLDPGLDSRDPV